MSGNNRIRNTSLKVRACPVWGICLAGETIDGFCHCFEEKGVASKPQREIAHIKHCLAVGYNKVFDVFAEERLLERTQALVTGELSDEEQLRVQLLHLSKLSELIYSIVGEREKVILPTELTLEE